MKLKYEKDGKNLADIGPTLIIVPSPLKQKTVDDFRAGLVKPRGEGKYEIHEVSKAARKQSQYGHARFAMTLQKDCQAFTDVYEAQNRNRVFIVSRQYLSDTTADEVKNLPTF